MSNGIWKIHHAVQTQEARKDWERLAAVAAPMIGAEIVAKYQPTEDAGWRTIDKSIRKVHALAAKHLGLELIQQDTYRKAWINLIGDPVCWERELTEWLERLRAEEATK